MSLSRDLLLGALLALLVGGAAVLAVWRYRQASRKALLARVAELQSLSEAVSAIAAASLDEDALCSLVYREVAKLTDAANFQIGLFDDNHYDIRVRTVGGQMQARAAFPLDAPGIIKWLRDSGRPLLVRDFAREMDGLPARPSYIADKPPRSGVFVPMLTGERVIGAMALQSLQPDAYTDAHARTLGIIANQTAAAILNARALARERRRARQLELVSEVARQTQAALTISELLNQLTEAINRTFGYYSVLICLIGEDGETITCFGRAQGGHIELRTKVGVGLVGAAAREKVPLVVDDVTTDRRYLQVTALPSTRSEAALPLVIEDNVIGVLDLQSVEPAAFTRDDQRYLVVLAQQVAVAVEEARLYELELGNQRLGQELALAREIQTSFLPRFAPQVSGWQLAASWQSAAQVGGDFYDFIPLRRATINAAQTDKTDSRELAASNAIMLQITSSGTRVIQPDDAGDGALKVSAGDPNDIDRYGLVIADVAGKGVPAAIYMGLARTLMRAVGFSGRPPAEALKRVNELIFSDTRSDLFVTMLYAHWQPRSAHIEIANGGHNPPLILRTDGAVQAVPAHGMALGVIEDIALKPARFTLQPGEALVFYTDGITDALSPNDEEFGLERLTAVCHTARALPAQELVRAIVSAVQQHTQGELPTDDQTLLILKREE